MERTPHVAAELRRYCRGEVLGQGTAALADYSRDFGSICERVPALVLRPADDMDVVSALRIAAEHEFPITTRGAGHSQSGQGLGSGLVLDMARLDRVLSLRADDSLVEVQGGTSWRQVVDATWRHGLVPIGLTHALDTTVAGTLSVAGVGGESFRCGPQVDNVAYLDIATLEGRVLRCSLSEHRELFDLVRAGLGQCGVILRVGYPLRRCKRVVKVRRFVYGSVEEFLEGILLLARPDATGHWLTATTIRSPVRPGYWALMSAVGHEVDAASETCVDALPRPRGAVELPECDTPFWNETGQPGHPFFRVFGAWSQVREPVMLNPWVEHVFGTSTACQALGALMNEPGPELAFGRAGIIPIRRTESAAPLFMTPPGDLLMGIGVFGSFPAAAREMALEVMSRYRDRMQRYAGKRYLSGYLDGRDAQAWGEHYAERWESFAAAKAQYDPHGLLNAGFLRWS